MRVKEPGHVYVLHQLDEKRPVDADGNPLFEEGQELWFVKRVGEKYPGNEGSPHEGTTVQEVLRACIDRLKYVNGQKFSIYNENALRNLRETILNLEYRAAGERGLYYGGPWHPEELAEIDTMPTCDLCGHTFCKGGCK